MVLDPLVVEWLNLGLRWLHVIAGISWIGASFYFVALDAGLKDPGGLPHGVAGEAWQVHGGGFYRMQKYLVAPPELPEQLTWFKWEAYTTWLSGFALLVAHYYWNPTLYLIDPAVMALSPSAAIVLSVLSLLLGLVAYEALCRSPLGRNDGQLAAVGFVLLVLAAWGFSQIFSGRGAFIQLGTLIGTIMVASVAHVIIPNQRKVVAALRRGETPEPRLGAQAKQRSLHNNYLTLPVVFLMISNHYPLTFQSPYGWLIIAVILVVGFAVRHFFNSRHKGLPTPWWTWGVAAAGMALVAWLGSARPAVQEAAAGPVDVSMVHEIVSARCSMCHAVEPLWEGIVAPPKGVVLETPEQVAAHAEVIRTQAVLTRAMPPGNITELTDEERAVLLAWLEAGAPAQ